jgi:hypothetical protein
MSRKQGINELAPPGRRYPSDRSPSGHARIVLPTLPAGGATSLSPEHHYGPRIRMHRPP